jgi:hypothetical protein
MTREFQPSCATRRVVCAFVALMVVTTTSLSIDGLAHHYVASAQSTLLPTVVVAGR